MYLEWIDVSGLSFNTLLLLERVQLSWLPGWVPDETLAIALRGNPTVEWFMRHKCPEIAPWLDDTMRDAPAAETLDAGKVRDAELAVLNTVNDLVVYAVDPAIYDALPFLAWDSNELTSLVDFGGKTVLDVGTGTGRLAFVAAEKAAAVFPVDPVGNLRLYIKQKAKKLGFDNVYPVDGIITDLPFPGGFADVTMTGHVYGDDPEEECLELIRVTKPGGMVILCPGNNDEDNAAHAHLVAQGFEWSAFWEPGKHGGMKRKYWKVV